MQIEKVLELEIKKAKPITGLKGSAFDDYLSSRVLLNNNLLIQGCALANSAIEKEFKVILRSNSIETSIAHDTKKLFTLIKLNLSDLANKINPEFIEQLGKIYRARYMDNLSPGFNFTILRNKFLAELDYTFSLLEPRVRYKRASESEISKTRYDLYIEQKDPRLLNNNYLLLGVDKTDFITAQDYVTEFRIVHNHESLEVHYITNVSQNDNKFKYEALRPHSDNKSFTISHPEKLDLSDDKAVE